MDQDQLATLSREQLEAEIQRLQTKGERVESYHALFEAIDEGLCIIEFFDGPYGPCSDYMHVEANSGYERHTGISDIVGKTLRDIAPDEANGWVELYGGVLRTGKPIRFERDFIAAGRFIEVSATRMEPASRRQVLVLFRDISERKLAEAARRTSDELARENIERVQLALSAGAITGTWLWDLPNNQFSIDADYAAATGLDPTWDRKDLNVEQIMSTVHPEDKPGLADAIVEAIGRGGPYTHQYRVRRGDGQYYWIEANGRVDLADDGTPLNFPGVIIDVQQRRAVEKERDRATAELRALNDTLEQRVAERTAELMKAEEHLRQSQRMEAVGQLTGGVAHDFNNLLTVIRGSVDLLRRPGITEERRTRYIDAIADTTDRAAKVTGQLLSFARRQTLTPEVFDVGQRLHGLREMIGTLVGSRIQFALDTPEEPRFILSDANQFDIAIVNIAANARDAMVDGGQLIIKVGTATEIPAILAQPAISGDFITVAIVDEGSGISTEDLNHIFEPFYTTKSVGQGTGLGLSQVFGFAKQSGGDIGVESTLGQGSIFTLFLPRAATTKQDASDAQVQRILTAPRGACVLAVEDNPEVSRFSRLMLAELGYSFVHVENADAALAELEKNPGRFSIVFSDVVMPGMTGLEMGQIIKERYPSLPIVLASGYSHVLAQDGNSGFPLLRKPYSMDQLGSALAEALSN